MNRKLRPTKSNYQIKEEQVNFLIKDIEKDLEEYKKELKIRDKKLADTKKILKSAKSSYDSLITENKQLKEYIVNIKQKFNQYHQQQEEQNFLREKEYFQRPPKWYENVAEQEEIDREPGIEESQYVPEDEPIQQEKENEQKQLPPKRENEIFEYLNKDEQHKR